MRKNKLDSTDFKLRIFVDTNILIDYFEKSKDNKIKDFLDLLKKSKNIELVTSDYVLWEFHGYFKKELYARKLVNECGSNFISANKDCSREKFEKATFKDIEKFGNEIKSYKDKIGELLTIENICDDSEGVKVFDETVEMLIQFSKFSFKDSIVFASALHNHCHMIVTSDKPFSKESHLIRLKRALKSLPPNFTSMVFRKLEDFSIKGKINKEKINKEYHDWFIRYNKRKIVCNIIEFYKKNGAIRVQCKKGRIIRRKDCLCIVKFEGNKLMYRYLRKIPASNFRDFNSKKPIDSGADVTLKVTKSKNSAINWKNGWLFIADY